MYANFLISYERTNCKQKDNFNMCFNGNEIRMKSDGDEERLNAKHEDNAQDLDAHTPPFGLR